MSLWKSGINRAKSGEERIGDRINSNIYDLKMVDLDSKLPYYVADALLEIDGKNEFLYTDFLYNERKKFVEKHGWRIPNIADINCIGRTCVDVTFRKDDDGNVFYIFKGDRGECEYKLPLMSTFTILSADTSFTMETPDGVGVNPRILTYNILRNVERKRTTHQYTSSSSINNTKVVVLLTKDK